MSCKKRCLHKLFSKTEMGVLAQQCNLLKPSPAWSSDDYKEKNCANQEATRLLQEQALRFTIWKHCIWSSFHLEQLTLIWLFWQMVVIILPQSNTCMQYHALWYSLEGHRRSKESKSQENIYSGMGSSCNKQLRTDLHSGFRGVISYP